MARPQSKVNINTAAELLRNVIWGKEEGELLGSEDDLTALLGVSRPTVRQVARLLEREGLLRVKRGINGGYFAARPSVEVIENSVSSYLKMVQIETEDVTEIASVLWMVAAKKMASRITDEAREQLSLVRGKLVKLTEEATFDDAIAIEKESREYVFRLINSPYIELIFHINLTFTAQHFPHHPGSANGSPEHKHFIRSWQKAKLLEVDAICDGDVALAEMAAKHSRNLIHKRLWGHSGH